MTSDCHYERSVVTQAKNKNQLAKHYEKSATSCGTNYQCAFKG